MMGRWNTNIFLGPVENDVKTDEAEIVLILKLLFCALKNCTVILKLITAVK